MDSTKIKSWIRVFRLPFHLALILPFILGAILAAWSGYSIDLTVLVLSTFSLFLMTSACFISNEYFDFKTDLINKTFNRFTGGSRVLPDSGLERKDLRKVIWLCIFFAGIMGALLQFHFKTGDLTLLLGASGMLLAYAYTAKPIRLAYRGLGEIAIGIGVGWLPLISGYYIQTQHLDILPTIIALPYVAACILLIWVNEFPDFESDKKSGKRNLVVILGREKSAVVHTLLVALMWLFFAPVFYIKPGLLNLLIMIPILLSALNIKDMTNSGWKDREKMEESCKRTIMYAVLMPVIYGIIFFFKI